MIKMEKFTLHKNIVHGYEKKLFYGIWNKINEDIDKLDVSERLKTVWKTLNKTYRDAFLNDDKVIIIKYPTGAGKTATITQYILHTLQYTYNFTFDPQTAICLLGKQYDQGVDEFERQLLKFNKDFCLEYIKFEGRGRVCLYRYDPLIKKAEKIGLSLKYKCKKCDNKDDNCPFYCNVRSLRPPSDYQLCLSVTHQINKFIPIWLKNMEKMIIIIDENFENAIKCVIQINPNTLNQNIDLIEKAIKITENKRTPDSFTLIDLDYLFKFLNLLKIGLEKGLNYPKIKYILDDILENTLFLYENIAVSKLNDIVWKQLEKQVKNKENKAPLISKFYFYELINFIRNYGYIKEINPDFIDTWLKQAITRPTNKQKKYGEENKEIKKEEKKKYHLSILFNDLYSFMELIRNEKVIKVIVNDATANITKLRALLSGNLTVYNAELYTCDVTFYQLKYRHDGNYGRKFAYYPQRSLKQYTTLNWIKGDIEAYIYAFPEIEEHLLISRDVKVKLNIGEAEELEVHMWDFLRNTDKLRCIKYPLTGTNIYEHIHSSILLGVPDLPDKVIEREAVISNINISNSIIDEFREDNLRTQMIQGAGRTWRGDHPKTCLILTGVDLKLPFKTITFKSHKALQEYFKKMGHRKRNIPTIMDLEVIDFEKIRTFLKENNNRITIKDCEKLYNISYYLAHKKLSLYLTKNWLKFMIVGESHKGIYYI